MIYVLHGEEEFEKSERLAALRAGVSADPSLVDLNVTSLDGRNLTEADLRHHCDVPPFLGEYRLVIVDGLLTSGSKSRSAKSENAYQWLIDYLPFMPDSTLLVLLESQKLGAKDAVLTAVKGMSGEVILFEAPANKRGELAAWVEHRASRRNAKLGRGVANDLANFIGPDLRLIDSELEKLAIYAGRRAITQEDVRLLVPYAQEAHIFDLVDALGNRRTQQAFHLMAQLRNAGAHPLYLLTMIVRQYRILLQVKELAGEGLQQDEIAKAIRQHPFPTGKAMTQARQYSPDQLTSIYDRLLDTDLAIKTGRMEANLALDVLVVELARL